MGIAAAVLALALVGFALRVAVSQQDLFADELSTYWIVATNDLGGVISTVNSDAEITPPLSFVLAWLSTQVDLSPEWLRAPSVLAGTLTIPLVFWVGARTVGRGAGLLAAALTTFAPFMVYYSAEARGYAVMIALVTLSTLAMLLAVDGRRWAWALYAAGFWRLMRYAAFFGVALAFASLAGSVLADDPEELPVVDVEGDGPESGELAVRNARERMERALLDRVDPVLGDAEGLLEGAGLDHHGARSGAAAVRRRRGRPAVVDSNGTLLARVRTPSKHLRIAGRSRLP